MDKDADLISLSLKIDNPESRIDISLQDFLSKRFPISRSQTKSLFKNNLVFYQNRLALPSLVLKKGEHVINLLLTWEELERRFSKTPVASDTSFRIPIIYEDEDLLVLHKPSGIPSAPLKNNEAETAASFALMHDPNLSMVSTNTLDSGLLHRLDTGTSGILCFARNTGEYDRLKMCWSDRRVRKYYRAIVDLNNPKPLVPLTLSAPLGHDVKSSKKMIALHKQDSRELRKIRGKPLQAITHIDTIQTLLSGKSADLTIQIETGVMHQIRCHLASMGWPIIGDKIYKGSMSARLWLHAWKIIIPLRNDCDLHLEAALPENWPRF